MRRIWFKALIIICVVCLFVTRLTHDNTKSEVYDQIALLNTSLIECPDIFSCNLLPGDILIKRQLTERTTAIARLFNMYFTHTALYVGNNQIIEARGTERDKQAEIVQSDIAWTDWLDPEIEALVILRPTAASNDQIKEVITRASVIANDENYFFGYGLDVLESKKQYCSGLLWNVYQQTGYLKKFPKLVIFPDDLFEIAKQGEYFYIAGKLITQ